MAVRFIIGRAGSGKSLHCFRGIVDMMREEPLGPPIYWILPKQETFSAERDLTCASGLKGFCRTRVASFELLGEEVLGECGGGAVPRVTQHGRQMIIGHLLRAHESELAYYRSAARQAGLAAELDATFAEMERSGKGIEELDLVLSELQADDGSTLLDKMRDIRRLYDRYIAYLGQDRLDPHRRLTQVLECLDTSRQLRGATVFVDGFLEFTDFERRMLAGTARVCSRMDITLLLDPNSAVIKNPHTLPDEMSLFHRTEDAYRRLWFAMNETGTVPEPLKLLTDPSRFENESLREIEKTFAVARPQKRGSGDGIELIEAPDRRAEVDAAARQIRRYIDAGHRFRDIAVLARSLDDYQELIDASFEEHEIPYFVDRRRPAVHHPLLLMIRSLLQIAMHHWPHEAVIGLIKSGLAGLSTQDADELENYVLLHRIRGSAWTDEKPWTYRRKLTRGGDELLPAEIVQLEHIDGLRRGLVDKLAPLIVHLNRKEPLMVRGIIGELFAAMERFGARKTLSEWIKDAENASRLEERGEHAQVWANLVELIDEMVAVLGDETVEAEHFVDILETGLEKFDFALPPQTVDQVIVGAAERTRSIRPKAAILLGMNDGEFPKVSAESSILSDDERQTLRKHRLELDADGKRKLFDEQLLGYIAMTRGSAQLCLIRATADDESRPLAPSVFWQGLRARFPSIVPRQLSRDFTAIENIATPRQLTTGLMQWVRHGAAPGAWDGLYEWFADAKRTGDAIDVLRRRAWPALRYENKATLSAETAKRLFHSPLTSSVSQIETFATCPFKHFAQYGLRLTEREEPDVTAIDLGNVFHSILEQLVNRMLAAKAGWEHSSPELINNIAQQIGQELRGELLLSTERNRYLLKHIEKTIGQVIAAQAAAGQRGQLSPKRAELQFGENTKLGPLVLPTPKGNELRLRGKIDRVDWTPDLAFAVIDYKSRENRLALDWVYHGLSLQLLIYLLVLTRNGSALVGRKMTPVAAFYVKLLRELEKQDHPDDVDPDDPKFNLRIKPRGVINFSKRHLIDSQLQSKSSDVAAIYVKADGTIGLRANTDACESEEFAALLRLAERKVAELGDRIIAGVIDVSPYRIGQQSPCPHCEYRSVCRFDLTVNRYHPLVQLGREEVLKRAVEESA